MPESLQPAAKDHVTSTAVGAAVGAVATGVALVVAAPVLAPLVGAAAVIGLPLTAIGGALGGWIGYNRANAKSMRYGVAKH
jgi:hypothetical protein